MSSKRTRLLRMRRNKHRFRVLFYHCIHLIRTLQNRVNAHHHVILGSNIQNFIKLFAGIIRPAMEIWNQLAHQADSLFTHFLNLITGFLYISRMHMETRHVKISIFLL